jgi:PAS domain S-box-containing protein
VNVKKVQIKGGTVLYTCRDITERRQAEDAIKTGEERYRRMFEDIILGIFQSTPDGRIVNVNPAFSDMFGYASPEQLVQELRDDAYRLYAHPEDRSKLIRRILASDEPVAAEVNFCQRDGSTFIGNFHCWKVMDPAHGDLYLEGFVEDITERKRAEHSLQESHRRLQFLSARLLSAQENEQRRISLEIHDVMGQDLALLKMQLIQVASRLRKDQQKLKKDTEQLLTTIDGIIEKARNLSRDLNPAIIEDLKLSGALGWLVHDIEGHFSIQTSLEIEPVDHLFSVEDQIVIYRIVQEALKNITKHAQAGKAAVTIKKRGNGILLQIEDDGMGFDIDAFRNRHIADRGLGLAAMDERGRMLGGFLTIHSKPGRGTHISLQIPVNAETDLE